MTIRLYVNGMFSIKFCDRQLEAIREPCWKTMRFDEIAGDAAECPFSLIANPARNRVPETVVCGTGATHETGWRALTVYWGVTVLSLSMKGEWRCRWRNWSSIFQRSRIPGVPARSIIG